MAFLQKVGRTITEIAPERRALLTVDVGDGAQFLVVAGAESGLLLEEIGPRIAEMFDGRGGGRGGIFQGKAKTLEKRAAVLELLGRD
jgi:misacylated tRNA(Ala) deacylase